VQLNWRVERIRDGSVILSREDPTAPNRPPLMREVPLHDPSEDPTAAGG
jgi:type IV pilus assembly protein PilP